MLKPEILISRAFSDGMRKYLGALVHPGGIGSSKTADGFLFFFLNTQSLLIPLPALYR